MALPLSRMCSQVGHSREERKALLQWDLGHGHLFSFQDSESLLSTWPAGLSFYSEAVRCFPVRGLGIFVIWVDHEAVLQSFLKAFLEIESVFSLLEMAGFPYTFSFSFYSEGPFPRGLAVLVSGRLVLSLFCFFYSDRVPLL